MIRTEPIATSPAQRVRRWRAYLIVWRLHRWAGLGFGALLVLLSTTGALLVVHHDLERWLYPERHVVTPPSDSAARAPVAAVVRVLQARAPEGYRPLRVDPGHGAEEAAKYLFLGPDGRTRWAAFVDPYTGAVRWSGPDQALLTSWLLHLHMHLHLGPWGYVLTGIAGVVLVGLGASGFWITRDRWRTLLRSPFRRRLGLRVAVADLHKAIGLVTLYFSLVLGGTGLWFAILIVPGQFRTAARATTVPFDLQQLAPIESSVAATLARFPDSELVRIIFPADARGTLQIRVLHRTAPVWEKFSRMDFDPATGTLVQTVDARTAPSTAKWRSILAPLHFGFYGATWVKWLYFAGGLAPAMLAITGALVWWLRRRTCRRPKALRRTQRVSPAGPSSDAAVSASIRNSRSRAPMPTE